ncbi:MAG: hypothetical protein JWP34_4744 [Massilia sp.]|nr:hypothetical protein [Massilia sp.]
MENLPAMGLTDTSEPFCCEFIESPAFSKSFLSKRIAVSTLVSVIDASFLFVSLT